MQRAIEPGERLAVTNQLVVEAVAGFLKGPKSSGSSRQWIENAGGGCGGLLPAEQYPQVDLPTRACLI
jgi:hypothetical protein